MNGEPVFFATSPLGLSVDRAVKKKTREENLMAETARLVHERWVAALHNEGLLVGLDSSGTPEAFAAALISVIEDYEERLGELREYRD